MALHKGGDECDRLTGNCSLFRVPRTFQHEELWRVPGRDEAHGAGLPDHEDPQGRVKKNNESVEFSIFGFHIMKKKCGNMTIIDPKLHNFF